MVSKKVSVSVSEKFGIEKVSVSVSKKFGIEKSIGIGFVKFCIEKSIGIGIGIGRKIGIEKSIGFGIEKIWYRKKVSDSVSFRFWVSSHTAQRVSAEDGPANGLFTLRNTKKLWNTNTNIQNTKGTFSFRAQSL